MKGDIFLLIGLIKRLLHWVAILYFVQLVNGFLYPARTIIRLLRWWISLTSDFFIKNILRENVPLKIKSHTHVHVIRSIYHMHLQFIAIALFIVHYFSYSIGLSVIVLGNWVVINQSTYDFWYYTYTCSNNRV